ncbi:MAG: sigma-70 family RNA polymerase sigma factor [Acidimicrobiales bacterium]
MPIAVFTDEEDLASVARGDRDALARLYERHRRPLFSFIRRYAADPALAEEILQDTLLVVWHQAGEFRGDSAVRTWLFGIARRQAHNHLRKRVPEPVDIGELPPQVEPGPGPDAHVLARLELEEVNAVLDRLSDVHREVLTLAFAGDLSYEEMSVVLEVPVGTVKSRVANARRQLGRLAPSREATG